VLQKVRQPISKVCRDLTAPLARPANKNFTFHGKRVTLVKDIPCIPVVHDYTVNALPELTQEPGANQEYLRMVGSNRRSLIMAPRLGTFRVQTPLLADKTVGKPLDSWSTKWWVWLEFAKMG
jgi:hypothetical protein